MDLSSLRLKALIIPEGEKATQLDWFGAEPTQIVLAPLFTMNEGDRGFFQLSLPKELELDHLTKELSIPIVAEQSEITGLVLRAEPLNEADRSRWDQILSHLRERLGRMARVYARVMIPEFNIGVWLSAEQSGKGKLFDISLGGMRIVSELNVSVGEKIDFRLEIPESLDWAQQFQGSAWNGVVKSVHTRGLGLEFSESPLFREQVKGFVDLLTQHRIQRLKYPRYNIYDSDIRGVLLPFSVDVRLKDISVSGSYLLVENILPVDTVVSLRIQETNAFENLSQAFDLTGRVMRITPDGMIIGFRELSEPDQARLSGWVTEVAANFRQDHVSRQEGPAPKFTLSVAYGSDLLFIREYLYNLSSGGLYMPGVPSIDKGEIIRFVIDLSGTSLADKFPTPPSFLGVVVRTTDAGISVQFLEPDKIRAELETVMADALRKQGPAARDRSADQTAEDLFKEADTASQAPSKRIIVSPSSLMITTTVAVVVLGSGFYYLRPQEAITVNSESLAPARRRSVQNTPGPQTYPLNQKPAIVQVIKGTYVFPVAIADIADVSFDLKSGVNVLLKDGSKIAGQSLVPFLPEELALKLKKLQEDSEEQRKAALIAQFRREIPKPPVGKPKAKR